MGKEIDSAKDSNTLGENAAMFHKGLCILLKSMGKKDLVVASLNDYINENKEKLNGSTKGE